jgi:hypothetical protein
LGHADVDSTDEAINFELATAHPFALFEGREVEKTGAQGALDFPWRSPATKIREMCVSTRSTVRPPCVAGLETKAITSF